MYWFILGHDRRVVGDAVNSNVDMVSTSACWWHGSECHGSGGRRDVVWRDTSAGGVCEPVWEAASQYRRRRRH